MGLDTQANDWQVCGVMQVAAGEGVAAGLMVFDFFSPTAGVSARFTFKGVGMGLGGDASGTALPDQIGPFGPWSSITADKPFSVWALNGAWGRVTSAGVGMGVTFGVLFITAAPAWSLLESYFHSQNVGGFSTGAGAGALALVGNWRFKCVTNNQPGAAPADSSSYASNADSSTAAASSADATPADAVA